MSNENVPVEEVDRSSEIQEKVALALREQQEQKQGASSATKRKVLRISDLIPKAGYVKVPLRPREEADEDLAMDAVGFAIFKPCDAKTLQKYREIFSPINAKRQYPDEANAFMIEAKFIGFEDFDPELKNNPDGNSYTSETEWFTQSDDGRYIADFVIGAYLRKATPNTADVKK